MASPRHCSAAIVERWTKLVKEAGISAEAVSRSGVIPGLVPGIHHAIYDAGR